MAFITMPAPKVGTMFYDKPARRGTCRGVSLPLHNGQIDL